MILRIPLGILKHDDRVSWTQTKEVNFLVKSAYSQTFAWINSTLGRVIDQDREVEMH